MLLLALSWAGWALRRSAAAVSRLCPAVQPIAVDLANFYTCLGLHSSSRLAVKLLSRLAAAHCQRLQLCTQLLFSLLLLLCQPCLCYCISRHPQYYSGPAGLSATSGATAT